ncbi:lysine transporter LysE [Salinicoccus sediminis]|uniref:Lysine transporter LysE n=1 Tax=Salinicoccus sediminis TaxID=1432562 RepID=A0A0M2SIT5_9STAP|nr:LysE family transporter [Salinicoccus sediminis]KKK33551.1 lysine transporter LysE [Salinicoccus sediminis]
MSIIPFLTYCFIVTVTPGPTNIDILSTVNNYGTRRAMKYTYGATLAFGLLLLISAVLNVMLVSVMPKLLLVMQILGSLYMLYLVYIIFKSGGSDNIKEDENSFRSGFLLQFLNPKVLTFVMTVIPTFILPYYDEILPVIFYVSVIVLMGFMAFNIWVVFGTVFRKFLQRHERVVNVAMALFLLYAAVMVWL